MFWVFPLRYAKRQYIYVLAILDVDLFRKALKRRVPFVHSFDDFQLRRSSFDLFGSLLVDDEALDCPAYL